MSMTTVAATVASSPPTDDHKDLSEFVDARDNDGSAAEAAPQQQQDQQDQPHSTTESTSAAVSSASQGPTETAASAAGAADASSADDEQQARAVTRAAAAAKANAQLAAVAAESAARRDAARAARDAAAAAAAAAPPPQQQQEQQQQKEAAPPPVQLSAAALQRLSVMHASFAAASDVTATLALWRYGPAPPNTIGAPSGPPDVQLTLGVTQSGQGRDDGTGQVIFTTGGGSDAEYTRCFLAPYDDGTWYLRWCAWSVEDNMPASASSGVYLPTAIASALAAWVRTGTPPPQTLFAALPSSLRGDYVTFDADAEELTLYGSPDRKATRASGNASDLALVHVSVAADDGVLPTITATRAVEQSYAWSGVTLAFMAAALSGSGTDAVFRSFRDHVTALGLAQPHVYADERDRAQYAATSSSKGGGAQQLAAQSRCGGGEDVTDAVYDYAVE